MPVLCADGLAEAKAGCRRVARDLVEHAIPDAPQQLRFGMPPIAVGIGAAQAFDLVGQPIERLAEPRMQIEPPAIALVE